MGKKAHTPGPWDVAGLIIYDTCMDAVATVNSAADARLIAAAPDMLGALEKCATYIQSPVRMSSDEDEANRRAEIVRRANAALFKATGGE